MPPQELCGQCRKLFDKAQAIIDSDAKRRSAGEDVIVRIGEDWKYVRPLPGNFTTERMRKHPSIPQLMAALSGGRRLESFARYDVSAGTNKQPHESHTGMVWVAMTPEQAEAARELCAAMLDYALGLTERTEHNATAFLTKIASGDVTIEQINAHSLGRRPELTNGSN